MAFELREGIDLIIRQCSVLDMAIQDHPHKGQKLLLDIYQCLTAPPSPDNIYISDISELEDLLNDFMLSIGPEIEDGSLEQTALYLTILRDDWEKGDLTFIKQLRRMQPQPVPSTPKQHIEVVDGGDDDLYHMERQTRLLTLKTCRFESNH